MGCIEVFMLEKAKVPLRLNIQDISAGKTRGNRGNLIDAPLHGNIEDGKFDMHVVYVREIDYRWP